MKSLRMIAAACLLGLLASCERKPVDNTAPDALLQALARAAEDGKPQAVWDALPQRYRTSVDQLRHSVVERLDPELWGHGVQVAKKIARVLRERDQDILPLFAGNTAIQGWVREGQLAHLIDLLADGELRTLAGLRDVDLGKLLETVGEPLMQQAMASARLFAPESAERLEAFAQVQTNVLRRDDESALVRVSYPDAAPEELVFIKVGETWTMKELDDQWEQVMDNANKAVAGLDLTPKGRKQAAARLTLIEAQLDRLLAASDSTAFQNAFMELMTQLAQSTPAEPAEAK